MNVAVIFAGGVGSRMRSKDKPKQFLKLHNKPIIIHTLEIFEEHPEIDAITVSCIENWMPYLERLIEKYNLNKVKKIVSGGESGQLSIYNGLLAASQIVNKEDSIVLIHDGVRPLINADVISKNIESVLKYGSAITSSTVKETIIITKNNDEIDYIPNRNNSRIAKAPQSFWLNEILKAHEKALSDGITNFIDSCSLMQHYGKQMCLVNGPDENIKITTPDDFYIMRAILDAKENAQIYGWDE